MKVRTIKLLKKILSSSYPISIKSLSEYFNVSTRTIQNLIGEANEYLETLNYGLIKNIRGKGVFIEVSLEEKNEIIKNIFLDGYFFLEKEERELDLLLSIAFSQEPIFLNKKEKEYLVSKSTMDDDMRKLRKKLSKYDIEIISNGKHGCIFEGSERSIRMMLFDVINKEIGTVELTKKTRAQLSINQQILTKYIDDEEFEMLLNILKEFFKNMDDEMYKKQILLFTLIWVYRLRKGNSVGSMSLEKMEESNQNNEIEEYILLVIESFELEVNQIESNYLKFIIMSLNTESLDNSINWVNTQIITIGLMKYVEEVTGIPFHKKEEKLYESLYNHVSSMISRVKSGVQVFNPILESIKNNYSEIYKAVEDFVPQIESLIEVEILESEVSFLAIHFSTIYMHLREESSLIFKSVVVCNHGIATSNLLAASLRKWFPEIDVVAVIGSQDLFLINKLDADLVFSTYPIEVSDKPLLVVDPVITEDNLVAIKEFLMDNNQFGRLKINNSDYTEMFNEIISVINRNNQTVNVADYNFLKELFRNNSLKINLEEIQPMLKDKLKDNNIIMNGVVNSWEDSITMVSQPLLEEEVIVPNYVDAMINSVKEHGPYIVIGKHLALAHARPEDGANSLGISVLKLATPIEFGNEEMDPVKLVFCLAATDSYSHLNIMKELVSLINDETRLEKLAATDSKEDFKKILFAENLNN